MKILDTVRELLRRKLQGVHAIGSRIAMAVSLGLKALAGYSITLHNTYTFECRDAFGNLKWVEQVNNLVTTQGLNDLLTKYFKGSGYTAAWYVGLIDNSGFGSIQAGDTAAKITGSAPSAPTTNDWKETSSYDESVRQTLTLGTATAGSIDNTASKAVFTMNATLTVNGGLVASSSTKGGTGGVLYGAASFGSTRAVVDDDTITVTVTLTAASA